MPFSCVFQLNNGAIVETDEVIFDEFVEENFGKYHNDKVKIAKVLFNNRPAFVYSNCPSFPSGKGLIKRGDRLVPDTKIAFFATEGDDIPYNRPYAIVRFEQYD